MTMGAYRIFVGNTGKFYAGSSVDVEKRFKRHLKDLRNHTHHCAPFLLAWSMESCLRLEIIETETREQAYAKEQELIDNYKDTELLLNVGLGISGGDNLTRNTRRKEIIELMTETMKKRYANMTPEELEALSERYKGEKNGMYGRKHTPESIRKISQANMGRPAIKGPRPWLSAEARKKLSNMAKERTGEKNSFFGKKHSDEAKDRMREVALNRTYLPGNSRKVSIFGIEYPSLTEASRRLGIAPALMVHRLQSKNEKYKEYVYVLNAQRLSR